MIPFEAGDSIATVGELRDSPGAHPVFVNARCFTGSGVPVNDEFEVNTATAEFQGWPSIAADASGRVVVAWSRDESKGSDTVQGSIQARRFSTVALCGPDPVSEGLCRLAHTNGAGESSLRIRRIPDRKSKSRLRWDWNRGAETLLADFGVPTAATAVYRLCIYDESDREQPLMEADIPVGPGCIAGPGGFEYRDTSGVPSGITTECFKTAFPGTSGRGTVKRQTSRRFKARGP